ncbi:MAG: GIY-YIG nuclease family protein [Alphaproteobacteria bacterium]|nr:GIY-YIG nuclease family protein [Alphaproteobacteria bacterium]
MKHYYIYILGNWTGNVLYIGMTNDLQRRLYEHKQKLVKGFTNKYSIDKLLYHETYDTADDAIKREKQLKKWRREKKVQLIETLNPNWKDLSENWN